MATSNGILLHLTVTDMWVIAAILIFPVSFTLGLLIGKSIGKHMVKRGSDKAGKPT